MTFATAPPLDSTWTGASWISTGCGADDAQRAPMGLTYDWGGVVVQGLRPWLLQRAPSVLVDRRGGRGIVYDAIPLLPRFRLPMSSP